MLQGIRDRLTGWVTAVIIGVLCLAFALWGVGSYAGRGGASGEVLAEVGDAKITSSEFYAIFRSMQRSMRSKGVELNPRLNAMLKQRAVSSLVSRAVLTQAALEAGFVVTDQQALQIIKLIPAFQADSQFDPQRFHSFLQNSGLSSKGYLSRLKSNLLVEQVTRGIQGSVFILPNELRMYYALSMQQRSFDYAIISAKQFLSEVKVTAQQIKDYYDNNQSSFDAPEKVSINYISLSPEGVASRVEVSDAQLKEYYEGNVASYLMPRSWKVKSITFPLQKNADAAATKKVRQKAEQLFEKLKQAQSVQSAVQAYNAETRVYTSGIASAVIQSALAKLSPGQVSEPVATSRGYEIFYLVSETPSRTQAFSEVKLKIKRLLMRQKTQSLIAEMSEKLSNLTFTNPGSLLPAAKALGVKVETSKPFTKKGEKGGVASNPEVVSNAFSDAVLQQGNNSDPIKLKNGSVVVLRVKQHIKSKKTPLPEVSSKIRAMLVDKFSVTKASMLAFKLQREINDGADMSALASAHKLVTVSKRNITREDTLVPAVLIKAAFGMAPSKINHAVTVALPKGETAVMVLRKVTAPEFSRIKKSLKEKFLHQLTDASANFTYDLYALAAEKQVKLKIYQNTLENL